MRTFTFGGEYVNEGKAASLTPLLREYRFYVNAVLSGLNRDFFEKASRPKKFPTNIKVGGLSERYKQVAGAQSKDMLNSWIGLSQTNFRSVVGSANLTDKIKHHLYYINKANLWFAKSVLVAGEIVDQDTLKLARKIFKSVAGRRPKLRRLSARLDAKVANVSKSTGGEFDYWVKVSTLDKGKPVLIPLKSYEHFEKAAGTLKKIVQIGVDEGKLRVGLVKEIEPKKIKIKEPRQEPLKIAIDVGMTALITTSDGRQFGRNMFRRLKGYDDTMQKLIKGRQKAGLPIRCQKFDRLVSKVKNLIKNEVGRSVNKVIKDINPDEIVIEYLSGMTKNTKEGGRMSRRMRRLLTNCGIRRIADLLEMRQAEYGYKIEEVNPAYTSQECRSCHHTEKANRSGEKFKCKKCGMKSDANHNGAINILSRSSTQAVTRWTPRNKVKELLETLASRHEAVCSSAKSTNMDVRGLNQVLDKRP
jgi:putative transposase